MATLTQTAITTRKAVRFSIYFIIFLIVGRIFLGIAIAVIQKVFPAPPPPPTLLYGKLPSLPFHPRNDIPALQFTIQTPEGGLPTWGTQAKVYYMPQSAPNLLALDTATTKAASLGFTSAPTQVTPTLYKYTNSTNSSTLEINIVTGTFFIGGSSLITDPTILNQKPPTSETAASLARNFLSQGSLLPDDLTGPTTPEYLKIQNNQLVSAISLSEANLIRINLFRKDYDKLSSVTANPNQGNVWFIISGSQDQGKQIVGTQFYYYPVDETQYATYPIKTADTAFQDLQGGKGVVANLGDNQSGKITITRVYLAYYDPDVSAQFYQPVAVFEGTNGFVAYVPAVTSQYYSQ